MQRQLVRVLMTMALVTMYTVCAPVMAAEPYLGDVIKKPAYARALKNLLDHANGVPSWAREALKLKGYIVETPATYATIDDVTYEVFFDCMPHNCNVTGLAIMFAPNGTRHGARLATIGLGPFRTSAHRATHRQRC